MNVSKAEVSSCVFIGERSVINAHKMQYCCVKIMKMNWVFFSVVSEAISASVFSARFYSAAGHEHCEPMRLSLIHI